MPWDNIFFYFVEIAAVPMCQCFQLLNVCLENKLNMRREMTEKKNELPTIDDTWASELVTVSTFESFLYVCGSEDRYFPSIKPDAIFWVIMLGFKENAPETSSYPPL